MPLTLKINLGNDIRRVTLNSLSLIDLQTLVQKLFGESLPARYTLKYLDDENDLVTVSSDIELQEALSSLKGILKFTIVPNEERPESGSNQFGDVLENVFKKIAEVNPLLFQVIQQWIDEFTQTKPQPPTPSSAPRCHQNSNNNAEVVHPATCDHCQQTIRGIRFKCTSCPDYDLCSQCLPLREKVHPEHNFLAIERPFGFFGRRGFCGRPPVHGAVCDSCDSRIVGIRHKCTDCADYDLCAQCFQNKEEIHPQHSFQTIERPSFPFGGHPRGFGGPRGGCPFMARRCQRNAPENQQPAPQSEVPKEEPAKEQPAGLVETPKPVPVETPVVPSPVSTPESPRKEPVLATPLPVKAPEPTPAAPQSPTPASPSVSPASSVEQPKKVDTESVEFKLAQLAEMGFTDKESNINLLVKHRGNLVNVIRDLLH